MGAVFNDPMTKSERFTSVDLYNWNIRMTRIIQLSLNDGAKASPRFHTQQEISCNRHSALIRFFVL